MPARPVKIPIAGELYCPHCGIHLFSWKNSTASRCPHLLFAYGWGDPDMFLAASPQFAKPFLRALFASPDYRRHAKELKPIARRDQALFCRGDFTPNDKVALLIAEHCQDFPEKLFPHLLPPTTIIFTDDRDYSGVHLAVSAT